MTYFSDYTILDGDARIIKRFKEEHQKNNVNIIQTYFETFEADRKYDIIVAGYVLEHVDDPEMILRKYGGILKEDGRLFITVPNATSMHRQLGYYAGELTDMMALSRMDLELGHKRYFTVNSLRELVKRSGFSAEAVEGLFLKPVTTRQMISLKFDKKYLEAFCRIGKDYPELCSGILMECKYRKG